jgi:hypothetical protein
VEIEGDEAQFVAARRSFWECSLSGMTRESRIETAHEEKV